MVRVMEGIGGGKARVVEEKGGEGCPPIGGSGMIRQ